MKKQVFLINLFKKNIILGKPLMGIDYGTKRIGVAISDNAHKIALPKQICGSLKEVSLIIQNYSVGGIVMGMPLSPLKEKGKTAQNAILFANRLMELHGIPVLWIDETDSSLYLTDYLKENMGYSGKQVKKYLDDSVAAFLLQEVLDLF